MREKTILDFYKRLTDLTYTTFTQFNSLITSANPFDSYDDVDYYLSHSSRKFLSQFVYNVMSLNNIDDIDNLTNTELNLIFTTIGSKFENKWNRLYQALVSTTYKPDENYNMVEEMMVQSYGTETTSQILNQIVKSKIDQTETDHIDQTTTETKDETRTTDNNMFAFNSASAVGTTGSTDSLSTGVGGNTVSTSTGNDGNVHTVVTNAQDGNTIETQTVGDGNVTTVTKEVTPYKLTRSGNIGVTTNQQMIMQEIELRKNLFKEIVYRDVDSMLTSSIYFY